MTEAVANGAVKAVYAADYSHTVVSVEVSYVSSWTGADLSTVAGVLESGSSADDAAVVAGASV